MSTAQKQLAGWKSLSAIAKRHQLHAFADELLSAVVLLAFMAIIVFFLFF